MIVNIFQKYFLNSENREKVQITIKFRQNVQFLTSAIFVAENSNNYF